MTYKWDAVYMAIRVERARLKWTQAELADRSGVSIGTIKNLEGQRTYQRPPVGAMQRIDRAFGWPVGTLEDKLGHDNELDGRYRPEPLPESELNSLVHDIVIAVVEAVDPDTPLSKVREAEALATEVAKRHGLGTATPPQHADAAG